MKKYQKGIIDVSALNKPPELHEYKTAKYFSLHGMNITYIRPSNIKGANTPDFEMCGKRWETKSPIKYSESSFEDNFRKATKQSEHIIYDLRRLSEKDENIYIKELKKRKNFRKIKTLIAINKRGELLTFKGKFDIT